jgi:hypothetical protein
MNFAVEHLKSGYRKAYSAYMTQMKMLEDAPDTLRRAGYPEEIVLLLTRCVENIGTRIDYSKYEEDIEKIMRSRMTNFEELEKHVRLIINQIEAGGRLKGTCTACSPKAS